ISKEEIYQYITQHNYALNFTLDDIIEEYSFDVSCQGSVPQALQAFFEATDFEDAIRNAISLGGDSDTIGAITGAIAGAYYGIPVSISESALSFLDKRLVDVLSRFEEKYSNSKS
ncbi:MAG: ADP-ribosylglycohydrolase family protein, partial [Phascolarctobacterium sp.]|nr:ADP-ribosylglycohydrolase family protein [Phascolarctobacterium sp.]